MNLKKIFKFIIVEFLYNGHLQSLGAVCVVFFSSLLFDIHCNFFEYLSIYLVFYLIYLYNRYKEKEHDSLTNKIRTQHISLISRYIKLIFISIFLFLVFLLIQENNYKLIGILSIIFIFGILYTIFFKNLTKKFLAFKNFYVASVFSLLVFYPFIINNVSVDIWVWVIALFIFLRAFKMQIILDLKDIVSDSQIGILSFGVVFGKKKTIKLILIINFLTLSLIPFLLVHKFAWGIYLLCFCLLFDGLYYYFLQKNSKSAFLLAGGEFIFLTPFLLTI